MAGGNGAESSGSVNAPDGAVGIADGVAGGAGIAGDVAPGVEMGGCTGALPHAASIPTISIFHTTTRSQFMGLILLEALGAMVLLILIVWWTMFSGRKKGELENPEKDKIDDKNDL